MIRSLALAATLMASPVAAQLVPQPQADSPRLQRVTWQQGETIHLTALPETGLTDLAGLETALAAIETDAAPDLCPLVYVELIAEDAPTVVLGKAEELLRAAPVRPAGLHPPKSGTYASFRPPVVKLMPGRR